MRFKIDKELLDDSLYLECTNWAGHENEYNHRLGVKTEITNGNFKGLFSISYKEVDFLTDKDVNKLKLYKLLRSLGYSYINTYDIKEHKCYENLNPFM